MQRLGPEGAGHLLESQAVSLPFKRGWEKKLDKLKVRALRVVVNLRVDVPEEDAEVLARARAAGRISLGDAVKLKSYAEVQRRLSAVDAEHELETDVLGCHVTLSVQNYKEKGVLLHLAASFHDGREPCPDTGAPWHAPPRLEKIRKHLGAPDEVYARGPRAMHWIWAP